ncbi:S49 family peptidase [Rubrivivax sp. A210]|uniref:S49 family peptidase n=1 Tax=Rubrivivax sp. A210 TaxID=2772301 RepID=UPI001917BFAF|nr:S49 family peptidase [Rubrivivax sp. A210]CAD5366843.1 S49 family peptidase [Rubrivivax sp. A210]
MNPRPSFLSAAVALLQRLWRGLRARQAGAALAGVPTGEIDQGLILRAALTDLLVDRRAERRSRTLRAALYFLMFALPAALYVGFYAWSAGLRFGPTGDSVAVVRLQGEMTEGSPASADRVNAMLRKAFENEGVMAIVLAIDSPGGAPLEAERIYTALDGWRRSHPKPVVAVINNLGASVAYLVALHADRIYAGNYSLVGSVGAVLSGWDAHEGLGRLGVSKRVYASGELKTMMHPYLPMSPEAERKAHELVDAMGAAFLAELQALRRGKLAADVDFGAGGVWGGAQAMKLGLVDEVSTLDQVIQARWPGLAVQDFGPRSGSVPFAGAAADWIGQLLARLAARANPGIELR